MKKSLFKLEFVVDDDKVLIVSQKIQEFIADLNGMFPVMCDVSQKSGLDEDQIHNLKN